MRAEVKVLLVVILVAVLAYILSQPTVLCTAPVKLNRTKNFTIITVVDGEKLYNLTVVGTLNNSKLCVVFYRGIPSKVVQDKKVYTVVSWSVSSTIEKLPKAATSPP